MIEDAGIKQRMASLSSEELCNILRSQNSGYSARALELAADELRTRTLQAPDAAEAFAVPGEPSPSGIGPTSSASLEPTGIGGWLIVPLLGLLFAAVQQLSSLASHFRIFSHLVTSSPPARGDVIALCVYYVLKNLVLGLGGTVTLYLFARKHRLVPRLMVSLYVALMVFASLESVGALLFARYPALQPLVALLGSPFRSLVISMLSGALWITYFTNSVRVSNTFGKPAGPMVA